MTRAAKISSAVWVALLVFPGAIAVEASPVVRADVTPRRALVGSPLRLSVTVLVPTWFTDPPEYPDFEIANLIVRVPSDNSYNVRENVGGIPHSGIVREVLLYPQIPAAYVLDGLTVGVRYAHPETRKPVDVSLRLAPVRFEGTVPTQAADLDPFIATRSLGLEQSFDTPSETPSLGAAITRTVTATVRDLPAMFVPPLLDAEPLPGLRAYSRSPEVEDRAGSKPGQSTGRRVESVTYMIEAPGHYVLPAIRLPWWNRRTGSIETAELPEFAFSVSEDASTPAIAPGHTDGRGVAWPLLAALAVVLIALVRWRRSLASRWRGWRLRRTESERVLFRRLRRAVASRPPDAVYRRLVEWFSAVDSGDVSPGLLAKRPGCEALARCLLDLERVLYADRGAGANSEMNAAARSGLRRALREARRALLRSSRAARSTQRALLPLNPPNAPRP